MNKKFLKSVAILGLATTALGTAQPVGAIVRGENSDSISKIDSRISNIGKNHPKIKNHVHFKNILEHSYDKILTRLNHMLALVRDPFYSDAVYSDPLDKLLIKSLSYIDYLKYLAKQSKNQSDINSSYILYKNITGEINEQIKNLKPEDLVLHRNLKSEKIQYEYLISGLDQLNIPQVEYLAKEIENDIDIFLDAIYNKQKELLRTKEGARHYPFGLLVNTEYWDKKKSDILEKYKKNMQLIFKRESQIHALYEAYKYSKNTNLKDDVDQLLVETNLILSKENIYSANAYYNNIVTLANSEETLGALTDILRNFLNTYHSESLKVRDIPVFKLYEFYDDMNDIQKAQHLLENKTSIEHFLGDIETIVGSKTDINTENKNIRADNFKNVAEPIEGDWDEYDYSHEYGHLSEEEFKKLDLQKEANRASKKENEHKLKESKDYLVIKENKKEIKLPHVVTQITNYPSKIIKQPEKVKTFTYDFPSPLKGTTDLKLLETVTGSNSKVLSNIYGQTSMVSSQLPYTQLIGGSNVKLLAGSEGERSDLEIRSIDKKDDKGAVLAGKNNKPLPGLSGERNEVVTKSEKIDVNYNVNSTSKDQAIKANKDDEKISNTPSKQVATQAVTTETKAIDNKFDTYYKNEADRIMTEYTEMRNSLHFYDWDAKVADLTQKGNATFKELEDALSNSKTASQQELINATDHLNVLRTNLERRKEELGRQELNKLQDAISNYNTAYNTLYSKVHNLDEQHYAEYDEASGSGRAITQYFDRLLSEGKLDYSNIFASESVKTELSRLEGFTTTLTKLAQTINQ